MQYQINDGLEQMSALELNAALMALPEWRREKAMQFKFEGGKRECACAFLLLRDMLRDIYGITDDITFDYNEHEKPSLHEHPDIHFNISHCKHGVACAISDAPVGIDIECTGRYKDDLARYTCCDQELQYIAASDNPDIAFTRLWTMKESLLKLIGTGITDDIKNIIVEYNDKVMFKTIVSPNSSYVCTVATFK